MYRIKENQDRLFDALYMLDRRKTKQILSDHPELINLRWDDERNQEVVTPLIAASRKGCLKLVKLLLDKGADVLATGHIHPSSHPDPITPLSFGHSGLELQFGALDDVFPLFAAATFPMHEEEYLLVIKALLSAGADVNQRNAIGQTALHAISMKWSFRERADSDWQTEEYTLEDDNYGQNSKRMTSTIIKILLKHGADPNICDHQGKSALHYAAQRGYKYFAKILLKKGANVYLKDKFGLTALNYAATLDKVLTIALIDKYSFRMDQIIQAYECVALNGLTDYSIDYGLLRKATLLRDQHGIPKTVLPPLECYGFKREWQTIEELEEYGDDFSQLLIPCLLARERISKEIHFDVSPRKLIDRPSSRNVYFSCQIVGNKNLLNSQMRYWLDRISYFKQYLHFADLMIMGDYSMECAIEYYYSLSNDVLLKFVVVAIDSCCVIQDRLNSETKPGCVQELISVMEHILVVTGAVILHLMKRSDKSIGQEYNGRCDQEFTSEVNYSIAKVLIDELLHRCPKVSAPLNGYASPVLNSLFKGKHKKPLYRTLIFHRIRYNYHLVRMIVESNQCDINAMDSDGNTILHILMHGLLLEIKDGDYRCMYGHLIDTALEIVQLLLVNGSYPHARNKQGKYPEDYLREIKFDDWSMKMNPDLTIAHFDELLIKYDYTLTLKYQAAKKVVTSKIPYKNHLPQALVKFVNLH